MKSFKSLYILLWVAIIIFVVCLKVWGQDFLQPQYSSVGGSVTSVTISNAGGALLFTNANMLYVDPINGNDLTARRGVPSLPWKTIYDVYDSVNNIDVGVITNARAGDTIVLAQGTYYCGAIPLPNGVNLSAPYGATLIRKDLTNAVFGAGVFPLPASLLDCGPFIQPGDNSIISGLTVISTNFGAGSVYDACIGWRDDINTHQDSQLYGFTNHIATNAYVFNCNMTGPSDVIYLIQTNTRKSSITFRDCVFRSGWDFVRGSSNLVLTTFNCDGFSTNTSSSPSLFYSRGVVNDFGTVWNDYGSKIGSGGGTNQNQSIQLNSGAVASFAGTYIYTTGTNAFSIVNTNATVTGTWVDNGILSGSFAAGIYPAPFTQSYGRGKIVQREFPNNTISQCDGMLVLEALSGAGASYSVAAGLPYGVTMSITGGNCGNPGSTTKEFWSTNAYTSCWNIHLDTDISSNRIWVAHSSTAVFTSDLPQSTVGFRYRPPLDTHWVAYSNDTATTNTIDTGVSVALSTLYTMVLRQVGTTNYYYINGTAVATNVWNPTAVGIKHVWSNNALNSQASGITLHSYYNEYQP